MFDKAIEKIEAEMTAHAQSKYIQTIGHFLMAHLEEKPEHAEAILAEGKTLVKALHAMSRVARARVETIEAVTVAQVTDEEGFAIVLQYFGCWDGEPIEIPAEPERPAYTPPVRNAAAQTQGTTPTVKGKKAAEVGQHEQLSLF